MKKRTFREEIIKLIYQDIFGGEINLEEMPSEINQTFFDLREKYQDLDLIISSNLSNWTIDRLNYVDLAIIRYATYEMKYLKTPYQVAINEALEITKIYSNLDDDLAKKFNNRLLENIRIYLEKHSG
ncbi:MAG: transcription antitermination protein NusB [Candidatus Izemoplasmatales bacterium]|nr:transcription antitermination protein NusB [Candidatus Izemoplasmatales bacterium]